MGYGFTWAVDDAGQVIFDATRKTIKLVSNVDALVQDMKHRLLSIEGEDPIHPTVGIPLLELFDDEFSEALLETQLEEEILEDPRIESVDSITLTGPDANRNLEVTIQATAVDGEAFRATLLVTVN